MQFGSYLWGYLLSFKTVWAFQHPILRARESRGPIVRRNTRYWHALLVTGLRTPEQEYTMPDNTVTVHLIRAWVVNLRVVHASVMPGTFSLPPRVSDLDMHHGTCVTHVPWCMPGSLTSGFHWIRWRGKRSRHSWRVHNPWFYISGTRPIVLAPCLVCLMLC